MRGRGQRNRTYIFKKGTLITTREPIDGIRKRQPVHGFHVTHQLMNRAAARLLALSLVSAPSNQRPS